MNKLEIIENKTFTAMLTFGIVDENKNILNIKAFNEFIDKKIKQLNHEIDDIEEKGLVERERNQINILFAEIQYMQDVKKYKRLDPYNDDKYLIEKIDVKEKRSPAKAKQFKEKSAEIRSKSGDGLINLRTKLAKLFGYGK